MAAITPVRPAPRPETRQATVLETGPQTVDYPRAGTSPIEARTTVAWIYELLGSFVAKPDSRRLYYAVRLGPVAALLAGVLVGVLGPTIGAGLVGVLAFVVVIWNHPPVAAYTMLGIAPFIAGFNRDQILPLLRPNELLLFAIAGLLAVRWAFYSRRISIRLNRMDVLVILAVLAGTVIPVLIQMARFRPITFDDLLYGLVFVRLGVLYGVVRYTVRTPGQVRAAVGFSLFTASILGVVGLMDSLNVLDMAERLNPHFPNDGFVVDDGRGAATIGNPIGFGGYQAINALLAIAMVLGNEQPRRVLAVAALLCTAGVFGSGQIGPAISFLVGLAALALVTKSVGRLVMYALPVVLVLGVIVAPLVQRRIQGLDGYAISSRERTAIAVQDNSTQQEALLEVNPGSSWDVRLYNLRTFFLPELEDRTNLLFGVTPQARVASPREGEEWVWIESGHIWLLWTGGVPLFLVWFALVFVGMFTARQRLRAEVGPAGVVAAAAFGALMAVNVAQTFDPHMTLRGTADVLYPLLALAMVGWAGSRAPLRTIHAPETESAVTEMVRAAPNPNTGCEL